ncbi:pneumococcal-type histidine triad protein, partial [Streptococcus pneumoniae]|uniref:pneumococcal-type histidine triad protein n=1 Tax=Streptococcus pneumoniae TaxID=1313 RepID=UPI001CD1F822
MKINKKYLAGSVATLVLSVCAYELGLHQAQTVKENNRVSYIDGKQATQKTENLTPDEVSKREGINAEQIVIKITDQGYVTSHGDHYHYYNGKVPYDAIISEELLMKDPNYQLKDSDIVNEIKGGYVIKVNGKYYVYLKDAAHADNVMYIHTTLLPYLKAAGEMKTKPTQHSVKELRGLGIQPNMLVIRTEEPAGQGIKNKLAQFCDVAPEAVIESLDVEHLYQIPLNLQAQ